MRAEQDLDLFVRLQDPDDPVTREFVVERFLPLARSVARTHASNADTFDDVFQVACFGLLKAIERFDPDRSIAFSSYAVPTMTGEIKRYFRDRTWSVRPPRPIQDTSIRVNRVVEEWVARRGCAPSAMDVAEELDVELEEVLEALQAGRARSAMSLDAPARPSDAREDTSLGDLLATSDENGFERVEQAALLDSLLCHLTDRERKIVRLRFAHDMTQVEIGRVFGISQMQVSRILRASLERLRILAREGG
jgi:RNA polymerase sigma-B factor